MRYLNLLFFLALLSACASQTATLATNTPANSKNINGLWSDASTENCHNCYAIIAQEGDRIFFAHYLEWQNHPLVEYGQGRRRGDKIEYQVTVTRPIPGWATKGKHALTLSSDGNMLTGTYSDSQGNTGPFVLRRVGK